MPHFNHVYNGIYRLHLVPETTVVRNTGRAFWSWYWNRKALRAYWPVRLLQCARAAFPERLRLRYTLGSASSTEEKWMCHKPGAQSGSCPAQTHPVTCGGRPIHQHCPGLPLRQLLCPFHRGEMLGRLGKKLRVSECGLLTEPSCPGPRNLNSFHLA